MKCFLDWQVGFSDRYERRPDRFVPATVPGNVQLDYGLAEQYPDYRQGLHFQQYRWMEDAFWLYRAVLPDISAVGNRRIYFVSKGIDYAYEIRVDGRILLKSEGMFREIRVDLTDCAAAGAWLEVLVFPAPKRPDARPDSRAEADACCKPAVSYGWDFHPRLIPLGIWDETYIEVCEYGKPVQPRVEYVLNEGRDRAEVQFSVDSPAGCAVEWTLRDPDGKEIFCSRSPDDAFVIEHPRLWWCIGYGEPALYAWSLKIFCGEDCLEEKGGSIGFCTVQLVMNEGEWEENIDFPRTRNKAPITLCLNGVRIFAKGSNWVAPEIFTGTITAQRYQELLCLAAQAGFNILRCWGGAIVNKDCFYDLCDRMGLLVWQEFPLACNNYAGTARYLSVLEKEATAIIERLRHHPCLAMWCGGNELFNAWSRMDDQSHALRLLNKLTYELDPGRPFIPTSPLFGMGHGSYRFRYFDGREVFEVMRNSRCTAYTEFGVPSISNVSCLESIGEEAVQFPFVRNPVLTAHHAFHAWGDENTWCELDTVTDYFGESASLEELVAHSQWLQAEGYRFIYEEARRQKPYCSMALSWCFNEPWPAAANNSIINYPASPKRAYWTVKEACRPTLASAAVEKFLYRPGETIRMGLWILNDSVEPVPDGRVEVYVQSGQASERVGGWSYSAVPLGKNLKGPELSFAIPSAWRGEITLLLEAGEYTSEYRLKLK